MQLAVRVGNVGMLGSVSVYTAGSGALDPDDRKVLFCSHYIDYRVYIL